MKLINFTDLTLGQKKMILEWRNHPDVRKWMYTDDEIALKDHVEFIESLNNRKDKVYFLLQNETESIGVIDFTDITKDSCEFGLYANPNLRAKGKIIMNEIIKYAFEVLKVSKLKAGALKDNEKAVFLYHSFNFQEIDKKIINEKAVICMELKNEKC
ncbi:UDP-4-amino-4,6-dideoxy-N-acetyl-beta-L-altrosamine N-acetyltransferase [Sulfurovum sp.]|uniref:UDP-4-amino-4, 6-dideoxy-N-acetyl-beta-L-altrosamine N-acetyltransferase n=1 Tax=Sulfurovum sp. TaxID=1969726 RepID=UPI0028682059|nr:UDP-4-amino-4,6-dideoxy-N-acetyl-beta-L-altrosamine N-acetyltransferase [Sulfurovum sp.]